MLMSGRSFAGLYTAYPCLIILQKKMLGYRKLDEGPFHRVFCHNHGTSKQAGSKKIVIL